MQFVQPKKYEFFFHAKLTFATLLSGITLGSGDSAVSLSIFGVASW